jgi:hypothetical protein
MKYYIVTSPLSDGHYINDIQTHVPEEGTVRLPKRRASSSPDFQKALSEEHIHIDGHVHISDDASPTRSEGRFSPDEFSESSAPLYALLEVLEEMKSVQKSILAEIKRVSVEHSNESVDSDSIQSIIEKVASSPASEDSDDSPASVEHDSVYVPETIRRQDHDVTSTSSSVETEEKSADALDEAAKAFQDMESEKTDDD